MQSIMVCVLCQGRAFTLMGEALADRFEGQREILNRILRSFSLDFDVEVADLASPEYRHLLSYSFGLHPASPLTRAEFDLLNQKIMNLPMAAPDGVPLSLGARLRIIQRQAAEAQEHPS